MSRFTTCLLIALLAPAVLGAAEKSNGSGSMKIDGKSVRLVDAFAYKGELVEYDEDGTRRDNYDVVLTASEYDHAAIAKSSEPVSDLNFWLFEGQPASITIRLKSTLQSEYMQANAQGEYDSRPLRCHCDGVVSEVKLENGRLKGRIYTPKGLKSRYEDAGDDDPSKGRKLEFDVTVDVPVMSVSQ